MKPLLRFTTIVFVLIVFCSMSPGENSPPPSLAAARAALMRGDSAGAARIVEAVVAREPKNAAAWRFLGNASKQTKNYSRALEAFQRALALDPSNPGPIYQIGTVYALQGARDAAFRSLSKAKKTGRIDMTQIETDPALASLKNDRRFRDRLRSRADFDHPFVEPVKIVREWDGEHAGDQFGWIARAIGDVDGDGVVDVVTSAPTYGANGSSAGRVYVYSTASGKLLWSSDGQAQDQLGTGIEAAGDTNGDGIPDVIASAPGSGRAYVYSGNNGKILLTLNAEARQDLFGRHVSGAGDVDHDGYADVIVGAPGNSAGGNGAGRAYVFSGKDGHLLLTLTGEHAGDGFGSTVAGWTDKNRTLLIVGAQTAGPSHHGRAYVYDSLTSNPKFVLDADDTGAALAQMFVTVIGDVDGDGMPDVYASDWSNAAKGPSTGRVYVASGATGHLLHVFTGETAGEGFGTSSSIAGDIDGDGHADLAVGAWQYSRVAIGGGRIYVYSGKDGNLLHTFTSRIPGDTLGFDSVGLGDVDGDGAFDYLVTSAWSGVHGFHSGRVFIISSAERKR